jgi:hypothetical protein
LILSIYTIWDGLSLKTISRYCPFKGGGTAPSGYLLEKSHDFSIWEQNLLNQHFEL